MKFTWLHLMPYRWLPADLRERYHSVWVDLPNSLFDPGGHSIMAEQPETCAKEIRLFAGI